MMRCSKLLPDVADGHSYLQAFGPDSAPARPKIVAEHIDLPRQAATCDPDGLVSEHMRGLLNRILEIFPEHSIGVKTARVGANDMTEYVKFVVEMHRVKKVQFILHPRGAASFFVVGKPGKNRLRPIWSGDVISDACERPLVPHRLGNPASFVDILVTEDEELLFSKRDAASFFDTLLAPAAIQPWFCFPPVRDEALCEAL